MARKLRYPFPDVETVESIAAGVAADPAAPSGEWIVRQGTVWKSTHPVVQKCPSWFVAFGSASTSAPYFPKSEPSS